MDVFGFTFQPDVIVPFVFVAITAVLIADQIHKEQNGKVSGLGR